MELAVKFSPGEINIICTDIKQSLYFYLDILGFEMLEEEDGCYHLRCGAYQFLLLPVAQKPLAITPYCDVPTFSADLLTPDLEGAYRHFQSHNVTFERAWQPGARSFIVRDPDGLVWEIIASR
jgi:catechol 2,3-dioxygenase-like lactoylglutathione lyase family enzyme